jgi:hypothetical protein
MATNVVTLQQQISESGSWVFPLLVGGGLALVGTVASQLSTLLAGRFQRRDDWRKVHREKFEELADCVAKTLLWIQKLSACRTMVEVQQTAPHEARRMVCLAMIYFPELKEEAAAYSNGLIRFYNHGCDCFQPNSPASLGALMSLNPETKKFDREIHLLRQALDDAIEAVAPTYAKF